MGKDKHFEKFGLTIPRVEANAGKKIRLRAYTLRAHPWLRLRALFGANWRADIAMEMLRAKDKTPYRMAKDLGCNTETIYRNLKALQEANPVEILVGV